MNFLGHIFLTPDNDELLLGNFIADSVKGDPFRKFDGNVAEGIRFHRAIDSFTDSHPLVKQGIERFRKTQGRYAPVVIDVIYDHVLAQNWNSLHPEDLHTFSLSVYGKLAQHERLFPDRVRSFFPFMRSQNWLYNYQFEWGLIKSLEGLDRRSSQHTQMHTAVQVYSQYREEFGQEFEAFITDAQSMVRTYFTASDR